MQLDASAASGSAGIAVDDERLDCSGELTSVGGLDRRRSQD